MAWASTHTIRRTVAIVLANDEDEYGLAVAQAVLGRRDIRTTSVYVQPDESGRPTSLKLYEPGHPGESAETLP
jgi:integrase